MTESGFEPRHSDSRAHGLKHQPSNTASVSASPQYKKEGKATWSKYTAYYIYYEKYFIAYLSYVLRESKRFQLSQNKYIRYKTGIIILYSRWFSKYSEINFSTCLETQTTDTPLLICHVWKVNKVNKSLKTGGIL